MSLTLVSQTYFRHGQMHGGPPAQILRAPVLKVWVNGHGRHPGTYFQSQPLLGPMQPGRRPGGIQVVNEMTDTQCGQLIRRKISKICATRCQILRQKCTSAPLTAFKGPTSKGREGKGDGGNWGRGKGSTMLRFVHASVVRRFRRWNDCYSVKSGCR